MKNLKFRAKFIVIFGIIIILIITNLVRLNYTLTNISKETVKNIEYAKFSDQIHMSYIAHLEWHKKISEAIIKKDFAKIQNLQEDSHNCDFGKWYYSNEKQELETLLPDFVQLLEEIEEPHKNLHNSLIKLKKEISSQDSLDINKITDIYNSDITVYANQVTNILHQLERKTDAFGIDGGKINENMFHYVNNSKLTSTILAFFIVIIIITLAFIITINITKSVSKAVNYTKTIAKGNFTEELEIDQKDEIGQLALALKTMKEQIEKTVTAINDSSQQITDGANEMNNNSQTISQGANEQASSIEEISSAIEQMTATINQNTDQAQKAQKISEESAQEMQSGSEIIMQAVDSMKTIADKISIISDIADKTDLLAINAAIEAARAGEQGRGFAVVALEIRKLAENTLNAAKEINKLTTESVKVADKAGAELQNIVPKIKETAKHVKEISVASMEQNSSANEISNSIMQFNNVTQQTAASTEELAASIEELTSQSEQLLEIISFFKINRTFQQNKTKTTSNYYNQTHKKIDEEISFGDSNEFDDEFEKF